MKKLRMYWLAFKYWLNDYEEWEHAKEVARKIIYDWTGGRGI